MKNPFIVFMLIVVVLGGLVILSSPYLIKQTRFGLEFRGGYEIQYVAEACNGGAPVSQATLLQTINLLRKRADSIGMAEPEISIEGKNRIRLKIAGVSTADQVRSVLGNSAGLPLRLTEKYTQTVGSALGNSALKETLTGGVVGFLLICVLLILLYRIYGMVASFCLVIYLWLLMLVFNTINATLSLSAIVAFVLGIGMAADASIIWLERVMESYRSSGALAASLKDGFRNSFNTIRDANLVTAIAMLALFLVGIGPIQGFSLTMLLSLLFSMVTSLFLLGWLCGLLTRSSLIPDSVLFRSCPAPKISTSVPFDFIRWGRRFAVLSILVIGIGIYCYERHGLNLDIDFTAGTALDINLEQPTDQAAVQKIMEDAGIVPATIVIGGSSNNHIAARFDEILKPDELHSIITAFKAHLGPKIDYEENTADPGTSRDFAIKALYAILFACLGIVIFLGLHFSWATAWATFIAIVHDMLVVSALFAIFKCEIDVTYVAAMLTIIGYSLNDKIVIFSRIRENLSAQDPDVPISIQRLVNFSIQQTMSRSIYTVLTVILASVSLLFLGCEPLQMFSLAILLGLISGAYSSIFMASSLWVFFKNKSYRKETGNPAAIEQI